MTGQAAMTTYCSAMPEVFATRQLLVIGLHQRGQIVQRHRLARDVGDRELPLHVRVFQRLVDGGMDLLDQRVRRR